MKAIFGSLGVRMTGLALSFYLNVHFAARISQADLGDYYTLTQLLLLLSVFYRYGLDMVLIKYGRVMRSTRLLETLKNLYRSATVTLAVGTLLLAGLIPVVKNYIAIEVIFFAAISVMPFAFSHLVAEYLKARDSQNKAAAIQSVIIPATTLLIFELFGFGVYGAYLSGVIIAAVAAAVWLFESVKRHGTVAKPTRDTFEEISESRGIFFTVAVLNVVMATADTLCLALLTGSDEVGLYGVASRIALLSSIVLVAVNGVMGPRFSEYWVGGDVSSLKSEFVKTSLIMTALALLILVLTAGFGQFFLKIFFGSDYVESYDTLLILTVGQLITLSTGPVAYGLMMTKNSALHRRSLYFAVSSNLILNILFIPIYGASGAAFATAMSLVLKNGYSFFVFWNFLRVEASARELAN